MTTERRCQHTPILFGLTRETLLTLSQQQPLWLRDDFGCAIGISLKEDCAHLIRLIAASDMQAVTALDCRLNLLLIAVRAYLRAPSDTTWEDLHDAYAVAEPADPAVQPPSSEVGTTSEPTV